ncbi:MAG: hydrogenase iron-sulfur subunit [Chloroflexi bacterium]|nr:hydrogenase iron-sulfur subunit [Chloroflexota bacterium]
MIRSREFDESFIEQILAEPGGEHLLDCWSCGTCAATCLVRRYEANFNPRLVLHKAGLGLREAVLSSAEIWQCSACDACYPRCPKEIHISDVMRAIRNIAIREGYEPPGPFAVVDEVRCSGCAVCTRACPYEAIDRVTKTVDGVEKAVAQVNKNLCLHCGICVAACPSGAMSLEVFSDQELLSRMGAGGWLEQKGYLQGAAEEPRILAFVCQWSLRSDDELQRVKEKYGDRVRLVNLPCSGRVNPAMILLALTQGADGVLVVGCADGECHYQRGTYLGRGKVALLDAVLEQMGLAPERVAFARLGAFDRFVLPRLIDGLTERVKGVAEKLPVAG